MRPSDRSTVAADVEDDAAVIDASIADPERFAVVFERHAPHIQRYLARRLDRDHVDDLVASTILAAFRKRGSYDRHRADARPWLYGIATNLLRGHRRKEVQALRLRAAVPVGLDEASHADRVATAVSAQAMGAALAAALAALPAADRDVLLLIAWEELSYDEVAVALAVPVGTVGSRLNRARRKVRDALHNTYPATTFEELLRDG